MPRSVSWFIENFPLGPQTLSTFYIYLSVCWRYFIEISVMFIKLVKSDNIYLQKMDNSLDLTRALPALR